MTNHLQNPASNSLRGRNKQRDKFNRIRRGIGPFRRILNIVPSIFTTRKPLREQFHEDLDSVLKRHTTKTLKSCRVFRLRFTMDRFHGIRMQSGFETCIGWSETFVAHKIFMEPVRFIGRIENFESSRYKMDTANDRGGI